MGKFKYAVGLLGLLASTSSFALGFQSLLDTPSGDRTKELHAVQFKTEVADCPNISVCQAAASINSEFSAIVEVTNLTACTQSAVPGVPCTSNNVEDNYAGFNGVASSGVAPSSPYTNIFLPFCPSVAPTCALDLPLLSTFYAWDFTTDTTGKITSGYFIADSTFAGSGTVGVFIFPEMIVRTYRGDASTGLPTTGDVDCAVDTSVDFTTCWVDDPGSGDDGPATEQPFDYVTVPMNVLTTIGKAVPVPALAALLLACGLAGITLLARRRAA